MQSQISEYKDLMLKVNKEIYAWYLKYRKELEEQSDRPDEWWDRRIAEMEAFSHQYKDTQVSEFVNKKEGIVCAYLHELQEIAAGNRNNKVK